MKKQISNDTLNRLIVRGMTLLLLVTVIAGCAGPWKGKIIDVDTKEPLEGAVVLAVWERVYRTPAGPNSYFYEAKETVTNKAGEFEIPSYTPINLLPLISFMRGPAFTIFKPGYGSLNGLWLGDYFTGEKRNEQAFEFRGHKYRLAANIVELPRLRTQEEIIRNLNVVEGFPVGYVPDDKLRLLLRVLEIENKNVGLK